jgi:hypothetical protein
MFHLLMYAAGGVATLVGYLQSRQYVRQRLRFVNAVQKPAVPIVAGAAAALVAAPVVWLLPVLGAGTAVVFGIGVGVGVAHGARDVRRLPPAR